MRERKITMRKSLTALLAAALLAAGCVDPVDIDTSTPSPQPAPEQTTTPEQTAPAKVAGFWADVPNGDSLRAIIDEDAAAGACETLQDTFDTWDASELDPGVLADLLTYIDDAMRDAGCYD